MAEAPSGAKANMGDSKQRKAPHRKRTSSRGSRDNVLSRNPTKKQKLTGGYIITSGTTTDPLALPDLVVDRIIGLLDLPTLLQCRQVCRRWNEQVIARNKKWKSLCQQLPFHLNCFQPDSFFNFFLASSRIIHRMALAEDIFQIKRHPFGYEFVEQSISSKRLQKKNRDVLLNRWFRKKMSIFYAPLRVDMKDRDLVVLGSMLEGQLVVVNSEDHTILWERDTCNTDALCASKDLIVTITGTGCIKVFSLDGNFEHQFEPNVNLKRAECMNVHPSGHFLIAVVRGEDHMVRLINSKREVFAVNIGLSNHWCARNVYFLRDNTLNDDQLAVCISGYDRLAMAIINHTGNVLHKKTLKTSSRDSLSFNSSYALSFSTSYVSGSHKDEFIRWKNTSLEKCTIQCEPSGIRIQRVWVIDLLPHVSSLQSPNVHDMQILAGGKKFFLLSVNKDLLIYRQDRGTLVSAFPGFFRGQLAMFNEDHCQEIRPKVPLCAQRRMNNGNHKWSSQIVLMTTKWLDGLCQSSVEPDKPIVVSVARDRRGWRMRKSLYWSKEMWADLVKEMVCCKSNHLLDSPQTTSGIWNDATLLKESLDQ